MAPVESEFQSSPSRMGLLSDSLSNAVPGMELGLRTRGGWSVMTANSPLKFPDIVVYPSLTFLKMTHLSEPVGRWHPLFSMEERRGWERSLSRLRPTKHWGFLTGAAGTNSTAPGDSVCLHRCFALNTDSIHIWCSLPSKTVKPDNGYPWTFPPFGEAGHACGTVFDWPDESEYRLVCPNHIS